MKTTNRLINLFAAILTTATLMAEVVYEPMIVASGFNRDCIAETTRIGYSDGSAWSPLYDLTSANKHTSCFATRSVITTINSDDSFSDEEYAKTIAGGWPDDNGNPDDRVIRCSSEYNADAINNPTFANVYWRLAPYDGPNVLTLRPGNPDSDTKGWHASGTLTFQKIGCYDQLFFLMASLRQGSGVGQRKVTTVVHYTDGTTSNQEFLFAGLGGEVGQRVQVTNIYEDGIFKKNTARDGNLAYVSVFQMDVNSTKLIESIEFTNNITNTSAIIFAVTGRTADVEIPKEEAAQTSNIQETSFEACWEYIADAASYRLDVAEDIDFQHLVEGYNNLNVGNTTCQEVAGLLANNDYYWRVRSVNADGGQSASSAPRRVKTAGGDTPATDEVHTDIKAELDAWLDMTVSQITIDRTLYRDGAYNTLCLPFSLSEDEIAASPLTGAHIYKFVRAEKVSDAQLNIEVEDTTGIKAGVPYLIKWAPASPEIIDGGHLTFHNVYIRTTDGQTIGGTGEVQFVGNIARKTMEYEDHDNLFIGANNTLYWPNTTNPLRGFRAYFQVPKLGANAVARNTPARIIERHETATGMEQMTNDKLPITQKIIKDNQIYILHNGMMYNVQGQVVK